jgi:hypothetical protein
MTSDGLWSRYEQAVLALRSQGEEMRGVGASAEAIARTVHDKRRRLAAYFKEQTPEPLRSQIYDRAFAVYGDAIGPTIGYLRAQGKTWEHIIESAMRPGPLPAFGLTEKDAPAEKLQELPPHRFVCRAAGLNSYYFSSQPERDKFNVR